MGKLKQKVMKNFGDIKNIRRFVVSKKLQRGERTRQILTGIFYALLIYGFATPCDLLMQSRPLCGDGQWEVRNHSLFSAHETDSFKMSENREKNLQGVKYSNPSASKLTKAQLTEQLNQYTHRYSIERNAKNRAYAYIISEGKLCGFADFCRKYLVADWHAACLTGLLIGMSDT